MEVRNSGLLDVEEAAAFCHVRAATIRAWILKRRVPHVKLGRRVFLRRADLEQLIERNVIPAQGLPARKAVQ